MNNVYNMNSQQQYIDLLEPVTDLPTILSSPLLFQDEQEFLKKDDNRKVIYTSRSNEVINVVKNGYTFENNQPEDILKLSEATLLQSGINLKGLDRRVDVAPNGSKMIIQYTAPEYTIDIGKGDETQFQILFYNSYDGVWCFTVRAGAIRMACLNGQVSVDDFSMFKSKHTPSISPDHARRKMVESIKSFEAEGERWARWKSKSITNRQAFELFADAASCKFVLTSKDMNIQELLEHKQVYNNRGLMYMWNQYTTDEQKYLGSNEWAAYNAMTHWSTHAPQARATSVNTQLTTQVRRQDAVRSTCARSLAA